MCLFDLNGGVMNMEALSENPVQLPERILAVKSTVGQHYMSG